LLATWLASAAAPSAGAAPAPRHVLYTGLLAAHVVNGRVDYAALRDDPRLHQVIDGLAATDPDTVADDDARLAFWINVYNAYTLLAVAENYPIDSINDLHFGGLIIGQVLNKTVWDREFVAVDDTVLTLDEVEHGIIRKRWDDPRVHFALVCAARSCPRLRSEAYEGATLDAQLDDQARTFLTNPFKNYFVPERHEAHLSRLFDWYGDDFGGDDASKLLYVARYLPADLAADIRAAPDAWDVSYVKWYWELNEQ
jgi:hypothetical protein